MKQRHIWAIICGALRQKFEFYSILLRLCELRSDGVIEGIVLSTWNGEVEKIHNLLNKLKLLDINVVLSPPIDDSIEQITNLNYTRQATQLNAALKCLPNDVFVLKCRTDFCLSEINRAAKVLQNIDLSIDDNTEALNIDLKYKIAVFEASTTFPFVINDRVFFGHKDDLQQMIVFESTKHLVGNSFAPDCLFTMSIFIHKYPILLEYFSNIEYWGMGRILRDGALFPNEDVALPKIINKFYALYFIILNSCFVCFESPKNNSTDQIVLRNAFVGDNVSFFKKWCVMCTNSNAVKNIVEGKCKKTIAYQSLYDEILRMQIPLYRKNLHFEKSEYDEIKMWIEKYFKVKSQNYLKISNKFIILQNNSLLKEDQLDIIFSEYNLQKSSEFRTNMYNIVQSQKYYSNLQNYFENLKSVNIELYYDALFTAARDLDDSVLLIISKLLYANECIQSKIGAAELVFKRHTLTGTKSFVTFPMSAKRISAIYFFISYMENNDKAFPQTFCNAFSSWLSVEYIHNKDCSYSNEIKCLANSKLDLCYREYLSNKQIQVIVDFLIEVNELNPFSNEIIYYFKENAQNKYKEITKKYENISTQGLLD